MAGDSPGGLKVAAWPYIFVCTTKHFVQNASESVPLLSQGRSGCLHFMHSRMSLLTLHLTFLPESVKLSLAARRGHMVPIHMDGLAGF